MEKETLKFKIARKVITYEGYTSRRSKDLMEILAKLNVNEDTVIPTFRENIEDSDQFTDDYIMNEYRASVKARAERHKAKHEESGPNTSTDVAKNSADNVHAETPQKISLSYQGKIFSYEGLPSGKQRAVLQLLCKQKDVTREVAIVTFRSNLPENNLSDDEIWKMVCDSINERQAKLLAREGHTKSCEVDNNVNNMNYTESAVNSVPQTSDVTQKNSSPTISNNHENNIDNNYNTANDLINSEQGESNAYNSEQYQYVNTEYNGNDDMAQLSVRERDDLNNFIKHVLEQPLPDVGAYLRKDPKPRAEEVIDDTSMQLTARTSGKIQVYCQDERGGSTKLIYATPQMSFAEFAAIVEKKYGCPMAMSFYEGDDVIELDDDDVLAMFLEMCSQSGKKVKLIVGDINTRKKVADDELTANKSMSVNTSNATSASSSANQQAVAFSNGELKVQLQRTYTGHTLAVYCCAFSPSGEQFVTASRDRSVRLWNTKTGGCTVMKGGHNGFVLSCDFSPKGNRVVSSSDDRSIKVWNTTTFTKVATLKGHEDKVYCVQYNPTGEYIVSGSCDHTVRVWSAETHSKLITLKGHTLAVFSCGFGNTNKGKYIVSGSDDRLIKIWDWEAGREVRSLIGHIGTVWSVSYSHNDRFVVSASMDHELKLWDPNTGACIRTMSGHTSPIHHAIFSYDDKYIYSCGSD